MLSLSLREIEEKLSSQLYLSALYRAMISTMYFGLFRVGEMALSPHQVLAKDVHIAKNKQKMLFVLRSSKTHDKHVDPQLIWISSSDVQTKGGRNNQQNQSLLPCPYQLLHLYAQYRGSYVTDQDPFFVYSDGSTVTPQQLATNLKHFIKYAGFDESLYGTHSLRIGRSCDLFKLGLSVDTIKKLGRWRSNSVYRYLKLWFSINRIITNLSHFLSFQMIFKHSLTSGCWETGFWPIFIVVSKHSFMKLQKTRRLTLYHLTCKSSSTLKVYSIRIVVKNMHL